MAEPRAARRTPTVAAVDVLSNRTLNRALLARNLLLARDGRGAVEAVEHLVAMQAQEPLEPYVGLWSRLGGFEPADLAAPLQAKQLVRTLMMRRTMHLLTAADALALRAHHDAMLRQRGLGVLKARLVGVDLDELRRGRTGRARSATAHSSPRSVGSSADGGRAPWPGTSATCWDRSCRWCR